MKWRRSLLLVPIPDFALTCSSCGGRLYSNPHPGAQCLAAALWVALCGGLWGFFSKASLVVVAVAAVLFLVFVAAHWYVGTYVLRDWPAFRSNPQR